MQVRVDYAVTLLCDRDGETYEVRIEQPFTFTTGDSVTVALDPEGDPAGLGPVLACTRTFIAAGSAFEDGRLQLAFADGSGLAVPVAADYESWSLVGPGGFRVVAGPEGKLTVWSGDDRTAS